MKKPCRVLLIVIIAFQTLVSRTFAEDDAQAVRARVIKALPTVESVAALIDGDIILGIILYSD